jgi:serine/arginine repetitive matrix protein 2
MSANRYPDNNRYIRDRSPYRDRRPSNFGGGYPPRANESNGRPNPDSGGFPSRDPPRGPKSLGDAPRGPAAGPPSSAPSAPRDGRGRGFAGRGEDTPLRTAPPLSSGSAANSHNSWRADRDRDRDREFDRRERRPTPPRRSPIRDLRDPRDQRDFVPRDIDINRARRNSRDGPPSAGSTYSDPPLGAGSTYRGSGIGRGRGGRDFAGRGRPFHPDERDRHHDPRDRTWRPRSRSPPPIRRERDIREERRDDRELDRRDRDDRRFLPREYDSYIGPAGAAKPGLRTLDTHRGPGPSDSRYLPGTPTGSMPHGSHHVSPSDRSGPQVDSYSRRPSVAVEPSTSKDSRRDPGKDDALLASRAEASRERYAPRPSSPPAAVPAFGSNVWRAPALDIKPSPAAVPTPKPAMAVPPASQVPTPALASTVPVIPTAPKASVPSGLAIAPPTGPKADRAPDRPLGDVNSQEHKPVLAGHARQEPPLHSSPNVPATPGKTSVTDNTEPKALTSQTTLPPSSASSIVPPPPPAPPAPSAPPMPSNTSAPAKSPPQGPAPKPRPPPIAPQAAFRTNASPQFSRAPFPPYVPRDASPNANASVLGPRSGGAAPVNTSPKSLPANIPTGPKADRTPMAPRPPPMYPPPDRLGFSAPRAPISGGPKSMQWVRPGLIPNRPSIPSKREFPVEERDRSFGTPPKAPRLETNASNPQTQRPPLAKSESPSFPRTTAESNRPRERAASLERPIASSPKPGSIEVRRHSDVFMAEASPRMVKPPMSAASSAPEVLQDSDDDLDLDEDDFAGSEAKYNRERELLEARKIDLSVSHLRATSPLHEVMLLHSLTTDQITAAAEENNATATEEDVVMQDDDMPAPRVQAVQESTATEPLTPRQDEAEDTVMEEKDENKEDKAPAPATVALRLRRGVSAEQDVMPDLSTLPYLGSGPPTPLSDIEQDRPKLPESVMLAIRNKLRKSIEPELSTEQTLQQYATLYKQWRHNTRPLDEEREQEDQERQPSAEPSLKATTPDVTTAAMTGLLDPLPTATGRRSHSSRWATELDLEQVIKESLKTAEEERMGKREKEPRRAMADPEKEADLPLEIVESEAHRRRYRDTNFQREPGQGIFVFHYEPPEDDFTEEEHRVMVQNYRDQFAKKWGKLAEILYKETGAERTYKDCINHYYATKWGREYKGKLKRGRGGRRGGRAGGRGRGAIANMERPEPTEDGLPLPLTETGRPRRSAAPTFGGMEAEFDPTTASTTPGRARRQTDADGTQDKVGRRGKAIRDKGRGKAKNMPLAAAPVGSPIKADRKEKGLSVKTEDELGKRPLGDMPMSLPAHPGHIEDQIMFPGDNFAGLPPNLMDRPKNQASARPGPSSYWSVSELQDFDKNVAHFGTDWLAIANHMGTKTHTMIKNQYLRLIEQGRADLEQVAKEADSRRERGDHLGPPPTPTPAPKRRYESTQTGLPRQIAPTPELHKSPLVNPLAVPKTTPPHSAPSSRFSNIAQAPAQGKPLVPVSSFPSMPETSLASIPSVSQQHSPPAPPQRPQPQHHHTLSQHKQQHPGPRAGYFSDEAPLRHDSRPPSQSSHQTSRLIQQHVPSPIRTQEPHQPHSYRGFGHHEREGINRSELQQEQEAQHRYQQHSRQISQEMSNQRPFGAGVPPLAPPVRSNSVARSPEHRPMSYSHSRHLSQNQSLNQAPPDLHAQSHNHTAATQQLPARSSILTPPVKEEPRNPQPTMTQAQMQPQHPLPSQYSQSPIQSTPVPVPAPAPKPAPEPRKSNLMSLLNDTETEEPRRKKVGEQGPPSHTTTPQQQTPIAPPPPPPASQAQPSRRGPYDDPYARQPYSQQSSLPPTSSSRTIDLTNDPSPGARSNGRDGWQQRQQFHPNHSQAQQPQPVSASHSSLPQPPFSDSRLFTNHRSVFSQHNTPRHNPSPPPHAVFNNSPHMHSRTPSISGAPGQSSRHGIPSTTASQQAASANASVGVLQPNPYASVEPPGSSAPSIGPMGMRPSPHLHTSHIAQQRDPAGRNEHSQSRNASMSYSNPQTPNEHPSQQPPRGPSGLVDPYRPRDPRDLHLDFDSRHSDRDTGRELSQRTEMLREQMSNPALRSTPLHEDLRYQAHQQDRGGYLTQRSHTPLSRSDHGQPPPLQHPPHSSLGANNHSLYSQRPPEEPQQRFAPFNPRERSFTGRILEEQAQQQAQQQAAQQAAMHREEYARREGDREREIQMRDAQMRDSLMRRDMRGPLPPGSGPGPGQDQRPPAGPGPQDWASAVRHPSDRSWQR